MGRNGRFEIMVEYVSRSQQLCSFDARGVLPLQQVAAKDEGLLLFSCARSWTERGDGRVGRVGLAHSCAGEAVRAVRTWMDLAVYQQRMQLPHGFPQYVQAWLDSRYSTGQFRSRLSYL